MEGEGEGEGEASNSTLCRLTFFSRPKLASLFNRGKGECNFVTVLSPWQPFQPSLCFTINRGSPRRRPASAALKSCLLLHGILCSPSNNIKYTTKLLNSSDSIDRIWEELEYFPSRIYETIIAIVSFRKLELDDSPKIHVEYSRWQELFVSMTRFDVNRSFVQDANSKLAPRIGERERERTKRENEEDAVHACARYRVVDANSLKQITYARA